MLIVDGQERSEDEIVDAIRVRDRCRDRGVTNLVEADDMGLISGRAWGMLAEPSAHAENEMLALQAGCVYKQIVNQKADGRFFDPATGFTLLSVQIKHSRKGNFLTSADGGTEGGKLSYNVSHATHFQFRESCSPCRSLFVELRAYPFDDAGNLLQKSSSVDHTIATVRIARKVRVALRPTDLVEVLKTRLFFVRANLKP
jgi:hypothetical protein